MRTLEKVCWGLFLAVWLIVAVRTVGVIKGTYDAVNRALAAQGETR